MPKEYVVEVLTDWYQTVDHRTPDDIADLVNRYYQPEQSNRWFFTLLRRHIAAVANKYRQQFKEHIDTTININDSNYCFEDVSKRSYDKGQLVKLLNDYRGVIQ